MLFEPLVEELARRGHQVTYIAGIKMKKKHENIEELVLPPPPANTDGNVLPEEVAGCPSG